MSRSHIYLVPLMAMFFVSCAANNTAPATPKNASHPAPQIMPSEAMGDPLEPVNRGFWTFNRGLLVGVLQPTGRAWRAVVPEPARQSLKNFARNVTYPGRVANHMLQGRWQGAGDESVRFLTNTTVGVAGLFDVASQWDIPKSDAAFGETFRHWGWNPSTYLMLPVFGPSDECNVVGLAGDRAANPLNYIEPLRYATALTSFNGLSATTEEVVRFAESSADPYVDSQMLWAYAMTPGEPDMKLRGPVDSGTLETLNLALTRPQNKEFIAQGRRMNVRLENTDRTMPYNCWMQSQPAPLVYINPGLGGHRLSLSQLSIAEYLFKNGYSVVSTTGTFHPEFMSRASSAKVPAYPPTDRGEVLAVIEAIDAQLDSRNPGMIQKRSLIGFSMGGFQALQLAATESTRPPGSLQFASYVAINPPVDLHFGVKELDSYALSANKWPEEERQSLVDNTFLKVIKLATEAPDPQAGPPFDRTESQMLIGLTFRLVLRDIIYSCESRHELGALENPITPWRRKKAYDEILAFSFEDYFRKVVLPYYGKQGVGVSDFMREANLRSYTSSLRSNRKTHIITNSNDFIKNPSDMAWMKGTFSGSRLKVFPNGGHLGNLGDPKLRESLLKALR